MSREEELRQILLKIIHSGILSARASGWSGDAARCAIEADHIHNLPNLVVSLRLEALSYYYDVTRAVYIKQSPEVDLFRKDWNRLGAIIEEMRGEQSTPSSAP